MIRWCLQTGSSARVLLRKVRMKRSEFIAAGRLTGIEIHLDPDPSLESPVSSVVP